MIFTNVGPTPVNVNLKMNTGWTVPPPEWAAAWRDTFWQSSWTYLDPGEHKVVTLDFSSAEVYNAGDEQEYGARPDGTTGVAVWRLDEVSNIGFQILADGDASVIVSAKPQPFTVYVDDDYGSFTPGWGYDRFDNIQDGIEAVAEGGTVYVHAGIYMEQLTISKNVALLGYAGAKIVASDTRNTYTFVESAATWDPIIFAYGGTESSGAVSGPGTINVTIDGFEIEGGNKAETARFTAILYRNVNPGIVSNNNISLLLCPDGTGKGPQTFGVMIYGDSDVTIECNEIRDFSRGGIGVSGDDGSQPDPIAVVTGNRVFGNGLETETGWWAENGIQIGWGAGGTVINNTVSNCQVNSPSWVATGIMVYKATEGVNILDNTVADCDVGIAVISPSFDIIDGNTVTGCSREGIRLGWPVNNVTVSNNILSENWAGIGVWDASDNTIENNIIDKNDYGIYMDGDSHNNLIVHNEIRDNTVDGIHIEPYYGVDPSGTKIHYNNITGNGNYGVNKLGTEIVNATHNWWGDSNGPHHATSWTHLGEPYGPHYGLGDNTSDQVLYYPWLSEPSGAPVEPPTANFTHSPLEPKAGETVTFDASASEPNGGTIVQYLWDFGDGNDATTSEPTIQYVYENLGTYNVTLTITDSEGLTDSTWKQIAVIPAIIPTFAYMSIEPSTYQAKLKGETFTVDIKLYNITENMQIVGAEFRLRYNTTLLQVVNVTEGSFLQEFAVAPHQGTFFIRVVKEDYALVVVIIIPDEHGVYNYFPSGNGTLATITFKAIYQQMGLEEPSLSCNLRLFQTKIADSTGKPPGVPHNTYHGYYRISPTVMGDVNYDGVVDIFDLTAAALALGSVPSDPNWNPDADLNRDGIVDLYDLVTIALHLGETIP